VADSTVGLEAHPKAAVAVLALTAIADSSDPQQRAGFVLSLLFNLSLNSFLLVPNSPAATRSSASCAFHTTLEHRSTQSKSSAAPPHRDLA
jgi:hypothetical protein